jgi:hypothetical protein
MICELIGSPNDDIWPEFSSLPFSGIRVPDNPYSTVSICVSYSLD